MYAIIAETAQVRLTPTPPLTARLSDQERAMPQSIPSRFSDKSIDRFWARVDRSGGPDACWPFMGQRNRAGYGRIKIDGEEWYSHRLAWTLTNGPIPQGADVCHDCPGGDNPACCNSSHHFLGTNTENNADRDRKGRTASGSRQGAYTKPERVLRGEHHGRSVLTDDQVRTIRLRYAAGGVFQRELAAEYGVSQVMIGLIVRGRNWSHIKDGKEDAP
jgi:HNH endonuclease